ncbi:high mobility group B protein 3 isoform X2 [Selaginella moellendorffii]|uniref:high mobility group B protein 3 isoform X2 n=1 Tax=Selaginella moellendorffii TaxID=88036 RepID=UPI000D1CC2CB|nr:high mobility group B protein 3 isoform X2 [Selaginella moellendorffii]XP_024528100.1 high mobility group B protein 3 isoform X2 [Selaginella moellendorffii]XP_024528104.1 high mobility group B protein 3 isoform X2 [Selaginella moellendorffii]XP_024544068.1 high mobility group B protein 3 isoform X2 [Selaginella moellendorffii]XP_024544069.1 high mobility group B protein 3 isoform X2 [Selaginella moellendorffii]XP_024544070.1 high mobility group B protein 3 isoform X2 [Selaginella moellendo|eukprot:XP_024528095.1 high mobility group B protein 3 isoform X2 [Selaginella moellendorffii]
MGKRGAAAATNKQNGKKKALSVKETKPKAAKAKKPVKAKGKKDPNQPKKPATAFFIFLEEFRQTYKKDHPDVKGVAAIGKAGGDMWKSLSDKEKEPYHAKAAKRKADYDKDLEAYNKKKDNEEEEEEEEEDGSAGESEEDADDDDD